MSDQPFYAPNRTPAPARQPRPGEHLWAIEKDGRRLECELRDQGEWGVEVQVFREGEFLYGRRWATRALALDEANERKAQYLREGGVLIKLVGWRREQTPDDKSRTLDLAGRRNPAARVRRVGSLVLSTDIRAS